MIIKIFSVVLTLAQILSCSPTSIFSQTERFDVEQVRKVLNESVIGACQNKYIPECDIAKSIVNDEGFSNSLSNLMKVVKSKKETVEYIVIYYIGGEVYEDVTLIKLKGDRKEHGYTNESSQVIYQISSNTESNNLLSLLSQHNKGICEDYVFVIYFSNKGNFKSGVSLLCPPTSIYDAVNNIRKSHKNYK